MAIPSWYKKVLDLGSNLGEISRAARAMGAYLVDGFEYDPYFLEVARSINAYNQTTRVSFYQRDITDPSIYNEHHDIVLAFSVFSYVDSVVDRIAEITDELFVLETHKLEGNLESGYIGPVTRHFPYYKILGESEWGTPHDSSERRAVIAFAKDPSTLAAVVGGQSVGHRGVRASRPSIRIGGEGEPSRTLSTVDVRRTDVHQRFFSTFEFDSPEELIRAVAGLNVDLASLAQSRDARVYGYHGWVYWLIYLKGYLEYVESGVIGRGNPYCDYLTRHLVKIDPDQSLAHALVNPLTALERVTRRFRDLDFFLKSGTTAANAYAPASLRLLVGDVGPGDGPYIYLVGSDLVGSDAPLAVRLLDGWHRLFAARLAGVHTLSCEVVREPAEPPQVQGVVEEIRFDGSRMTLRGWCVDSSRPIHAVDARAAGHLLARAATTFGLDLKARCPTITHAAPAGFEAECQTRLSTESVTRLDVLPLNDWLPIGALTVYCLPGVQGSGEVARAPLPPDAVVAVVSKGDEDLLRLLGGGAWHFPLADGGIYAGYHPADSDEAIAQLEAVRGRGAEYVLFPKPSLWWLDHYGDFRRYLEQRYRPVVWQEDSCVIFDLREPTNIDGER